MIETAGAMVVEVTDVYGNVVNAVAMPTTVELMLAMHHRRPGWLLMNLYLAVDRSRVVAATRNPDGSMIGTIPKFAALAQAVARVRAQN